MGRRRRRTQNSVFLGSDLKYLMRASIILGKEASYYGKKGIRYVKSKHIESQSIYKKRGD